MSPAGLEASGGTIYNQRIAAQWGAAVEYVPGGWPLPHDAHRARLLDLLLAGSQQDSVLLDGLIGSAAPDEVAAARDAGVRIVILVHLPLPAETGLTSAEQEQLAAWEARALGVASAVACTSSWAARDLGRRYGLGDVAVAEPGTDPQPLACGSRPVQLITPASFTPRKNHRLLIEALASPVLADLDWHALWLGADPTGSAREELSYGVAAAGLADRVRLNAARTGTDLDAAWASSDLVLLPSLTETYAMVVTEGLARGIPAVVGAGTAAEDTLRGGASPLRHGVTTPGSGMPGEALATDDPSSWAATIAGWLTSADLRDQWRWAATQRRDQLSAWSVPAGILAGLMRAQ
ncbi:MAG: glycosyltransferase family 4 protein [Ornithinimicrobium sp.]